jgi:uncharacterized membrane protein YeaQ/YmgE (transglycosylase-associated protein family)
MQLTAVTVCAWILFGIVVGVLARIIVPGRDLAGLLAAVVLGIIGALIGGFIAYGLNLGIGPYDPGGWILSIVCAIFAVALYYWARGTRPA